MICYHCKKDYTNDKDNVLIQKNNMNGLWECIDCAYELDQYKLQPKTIHEAGLIYFIYLWCCTLIRTQKIYYWRRY